jgi:tmRNA-binding protein
MKQKMDLHLKKNALHRELGVKKGEKLTEKEETVHKGDSKLEKERKVFAQNAKHWNKR